MTDQHQQHLDDDRRFQRGGGLAGAAFIGACLPRAPLRVSDSGVGGMIDSDSSHALALQCPLPHRGQ